VETVNIMTRHAKLSPLPVRYAVTALLAALLLSAALLPPTGSPGAAPESVPEEATGAGWKLCAMGIAMAVLGFASNNGAMGSAGCAIASTGC
jgi:hypothetical protein